MRKNRLPNASGPKLAPLSVPDPERAFRSHRTTARQASEAVRSKSDLVRMKRAIQAVSLQRVYMRNEMFQEPLTEKEITRRFSLGARLEGRREA